MLTHFVEHRSGGCAYERNGGLIKMSNGDDAFRRILRKSDLQDMGVKIGSGEVDKAKRARLDVTNLVITASRDEQLVQTDARSRVDSPSGPSPRKDVTRTIYLDRKSVL